MDFEIRKQSVGGGICLIELGGELDVYSCRHARSELRRLAQGEERDFLLDLGRLTFIDSAGLGMLVRFLREVRSRQGLLVLTGANQPVRRLFRMTGLDTLFSMVESRREALRCLGRDRAAADQVQPRNVLEGPSRL